jgi:hypothetical protein
MRFSKLAILGGAAACISLYAACGGSTSTESPPGSDAGTPNVDGGVTPGCTPCATDQDCKGDVCAELGSGHFCARACPTGNECASDTSCEPATSAGGAQVEVCAPRTACAEPDGGTGGSDASVPFDGGSGPPTGTVGPTGGSLSRLLFGVVGDTRPPMPITTSDLSSYPTATITKIFQDLEALPAKPPFVLSTGDYQFAYTGSTSTAAAQLDLYMGARAKYSGVTFPAMGNHECTGATASNCGQGNTNGVTANFTAFQQKMLAPIQKSLPYYSIEVDALDKSWTSKFVFVAANAWNQAQADWLKTTLAAPTTYTFVVRHESATANPTAPGVAPSEAIMAMYPYTLAIVGHSHTYYHGRGSREVTIGNGGAPLSSKTYGYGIFSQRSDGAIVVDMIDFMSGAADGSFHFVVKPDGTATN